MVLIVPSMVKRISETSEGAWASISGILCKLLTRNEQFGAHFLAKMIFFTALKFCHRIATGVFAKFCILLVTCLGHVLTRCRRRGCSQSTLHTC